MLIGALPAEAEFIGRIFPKARDLLKTAFMRKD
jgi:hypothetical protein